MNIEKTSAPARFYAPELDGLRFIAALLVYIHHAPELGVLAHIRPYGWVGVDLFLTISAFLITRLIVLEHESRGSFDIRAFFVRRVLRIWPLYLFFVTALSVAAAIKGFDSSIVTAWWLSHISVTNNVMTAVHGYSPVPFTAHLWTISLEEQAYIILPLLLSVFLASGSNHRIALWFSASLISILIVARTALVLADTAHPFIWVLPLRGDAFILGSLAAILVRAPLRSGFWAFAAGGVLLLSVTLFRDIGQAGPGQVFGYTLVALGCVSIVLAAQAEGPGRAILGNPVARYLGKISYGLYVYHLVAIHLAGKLGLDAVSAFAVGLLLTIAMAAVSYAVLERPFLVLKERFARVGSRPV